MLPGVGAVKPLPLSDADRTRGLELLRAFTRAELRAIWERLPGVPADDPPLPYGQRAIAETVAFYLARLGFDGISNEGLRRFGATALQLRTAPPDVTGRIARAERQS